MYNYMLDNSQIALIMTIENYLAVSAPAAFGRVCTASAGMLKRRERGQDHGICL